MIDENESQTEAQTEEIEGALEEASTEPESAEESARTVYEELKAAANETEETDIHGSEVGEEEKPTVDASEAARILARSRNKGTKKRRVVEKDELSTEAPETRESDKLTPIQPPQRFPVEKKEWFNRQPREIQEDLANGWQELERHTQNVWQQAHREKSQAENINRIVSHYLPRWGMSGLTPDQAIAELCAAQDSIQANPLAAFTEILAKSGVSPEDLIHYRDQGGPVSQVSRNRESSSLSREDLVEIIRNENNRVLQEQAQQQALGELNALKGETDALGNYVYRELHDDAFVMHRVKPLVESLRTTHPALPISEATKRAIHTLRVLDGTAGSPPNRSRLPEQNQHDLARAKAASVSVRGRGNPAIATMYQAQPGESAEDSARAVYAALFNGQ